VDRSKVPIVSDYMTPGPYCVAPHDLLLKAYALMREHEIRHLPVLRGSELVGALSDQDVNLAQRPQPAGSEQATVEDAMTTEPYAVAPDTPINQVARVMVKRKIGSAVVLDRRQIVGVFTLTDALWALIEALEGTSSRRRYEAVTTQPPEARRPSDMR
jgi:acetoin utilization protein AcuB